MPVRAEPGWAAWCAASEERKPETARTAAKAPAPSAKARVSAAVHNPVKVAARCRPVRTASAARLSASIVSGSNWSPP